MGNLYTITIIYYDIGEGNKYDTSIVYLSWLTRAGNTR